MTSTADRVDDIDYQIWIGTVVTVVAATGAVTLRLVSRHIAKAGYWWDDWVIIASLVYLATITIISESRAERYRLSTGAWQPRAGRKSSYMTLEDTAKTTPSRT